MYVGCLSRHYLRSFANTSIYFTKRRDVHMCTFSDHEPSGVQVGDPQNVRIHVQGSKPAVRADVPTKLNFLGPVLLIIIQVSQC